MFRRANGPRKLAKEENTIIHVCAIWEIAGSSAMDWTNTVTYRSGDCHRVAKVSGSEQ
jgi:hypothetical protein